MGRGEREGREGGREEEGDKGEKDSENTKEWRHVTVTCINCFIAHFDCYIKSWLVHASKCLMRLHVSVLR